MYLSSPGTLFTRVKHERGLQRCSIRLVCRSLHSTPYRLQEISRVAVLGGGITGLSATYYLSKALPASTEIVLFEASPRLGGWLNSTSVDVGNGNVVFESGPRTLRSGSASGLVTLDLIGQLGLQQRIITTDKTSPAAQNRFIYYPDHLVRMPGPGRGILGNIKAFWQEPMFDGVIAGLIGEVTKPPRSAEVKDESIGSFISRRFGSVVADNIASAIFHGIYAGDIYKLSARTLLPALWHIESKHSSIMRGFVDQMFGGLKPIAANDLSILRDKSRSLPYAREMPKRVKEASVFTFRNGLGELVPSFKEALAKKQNVKFRNSTLIQKIELPTQEAGLRIRYKADGDLPEKLDTHSDFSHIIATISSSKLAKMLNDSFLSKTLGMTPSVTVMVVNLFYHNPSVLDVHGFGYLLPRSLPLEQNPEAALGVVFDTDATLGQDAVPGTKITVMLGGHWWSMWDDYPDEERGAHMAKSVLKRHLGIEEEPGAIRVSLQKDCIPQYLVGHDDRMTAISGALETAYQGKLTVAGSSYTGVGVNDCVRAARDVVSGIVNGTAKTGLESFVNGRPWTWVQRGVATLT